MVLALQRHFADGRLTEDELNERLEQVLGARTLGQLYALTADLPELPVVEVPRSSSTRRRRRWRD